MVFHLFQFLKVTDSNFDWEKHYSEEESLHEIYSERVYLIFLAKNEKFRAKVKVVGKVNARLFKKIKSLFPKNQPDDIAYLLSSLAHIHEKLVGVYSFLKEFNTIEKIHEEFELQGAMEFRDAFSSKTTFLVAQIESFKTELKTAIPFFRKSQEVFNPDKLIHELLNLEIDLSNLEKDLSGQINKIIKTTNEYYFAEKEHEKRRRDTNH